MILFLDFDGVTHPEFCSYDDYFCKLPLIEEVLREFPNVEIVVSSTWRLEFEDEAESTAQMKKHFSFDIAPRVAGVTPDLRSPERKRELSKWLERPRDRECMAWLHRYRTPQTPWIAHDDTQEWFGQNTAQVMIIDGSTGFTQEHEDEFRRRLTEGAWESTTLGDR
jgi:hypothetical protein